MATELGTCTGDPSNTLTSRLDEESDLCVVHMVTDSTKIDEMAHELAQEYSIKYPHCSRLIQYINRRSISRKIAMIIIGK